METAATDARDGDELAALHRYFVVVVIVWTVLVLSAFAWNARQKHAETSELAHTQAETILQKDLSIRAWLASHGGVYVFPDENTPPNPYLKHLPERDIVTTTGKTLTLMNPAYVNRQLFELYTEKYGIKGHITSLDPLNPRNRPLAWEEKALRTFEQGAKEATEIIALEGVKYYGLMRPLVTEKPCLKCHEHQGYKLGDIRGGISASVPLAQLYAAEQRALWTMGATHGVIWMLVLLGIVLMSRRTVCRTRERQKDRRELIESRHLFQTVADFASDWIFWRNPNGSLRYVSPACEQISGYSAKEFYETPSLFNEIIHPDDRERWVNHAHQADENGYPCPLEFRLVTKQGETRFISHACRPIFDDRQNRFLGVRGSNNDITARREHEQLLIHQSRLAAMGEMMGNISHQWRQPLNALGLVLANIKDAYAYNELDKEYLDKSVENGEKLILKMSCTIDDFRNFFKPNKAKQQFGLCQAVADTLNLVSASFKTNNIDIHFKCDEENSVNGFPNEFSQVLLNVLSNARDAVVEREMSSGKIEISMAHDEKNAWVVVRDNAGGIPVDVFPKIFEPYFTTKEKGSGIGLYMSNMIMEHMDGKIEARNAGDGAEFMIVLPKWAQ